MFDGCAKSCGIEDEIPAAAEVRRTVWRRLSWVQVATFGLEHVAEHDEGVTLVALTGELDLTNVDELDARLAALANGLPLVLDLSRLVFVDSAALHRLFRIVRERGVGGVAFVIEPTAPVATTLAIVGLGRAAPLVATRDDAVETLRRPSPS